MILERFPAPLDNGACAINSGCKITASLSAQTINGTIRTDAGFPAEFATVKLSVNDIFGTQRWSQSADFGTVRGTIRNTWESQNIALSFTWKFGNQHLKTRNRNNGGATDADERIKARKE